MRQHQRRTEEVGAKGRLRLCQVKNLPERNLAVELLERLLEGEIKSKFATNIVQQKKFSDLLNNVITRYA